MICLEKVSIAASIPLKWKGIGFALDETEHFQSSLDITESGQQGNPKNSLKREREHMHECTTIV